MSCWYKPAELSKRIALFYTASLVSGAFGGLLAGAIIEGMDEVAGVRGWKWWVWSQVMRPCTNPRLFIIEGLATCVVAAAAFFVLPSEPIAKSFKVFLLTRKITRPPRDGCLTRRRPSPSTVSNNSTRPKATCLTDEPSSRPSRTPELGPLCSLTTSSTLSAPSRTSSPP
jgi:MFS family permease